MSNSRFMEQLLDGAEVEWKALGDIAKIKHGKDWKGLKKGNIPIYGSGGIMGCVDTYLYNKPTVLIPRKGSITNIFYVDTPFWNVDTIYYTEIDDTEIVPKFLYYFIKTIDLMALDTGSGRPSLTQAILNKIQIPIPPLRAQAEIVRMLDAFTKLTNELTNELNARKKQYNYYRNQLLSFEEGEIEWKTLGEVSEIKRGRRLVKNQLEEFGKYAVFQNSMTPLGYYHESNVHADTTFIISAGSAGEIGYSEVDFWAADDVYYFVTPENLKSKFLYYFLLTQQTKITSQVRRSSVPRLSKTIFEKMTIPVPPLIEQKRIVAILDKFDALTNSLTEGLPREIALRQQQYAYYRDLLLSFPKYNPLPTSPLAGGGVG